jgi:hypothetical protein
MTLALAVALIGLALFAPPTHYRNRGRIITNLAIGWESSRGVMVLIGLPVLVAAVFGLAVGR